MYDTIIIGGGPAGIAAAIYAARKKMKAAIIAEAFGGQSIVSDSIENWIGEKQISGIELAKKLEDHIRAQKKIEIKSPEKATKVSELKDGYLVETDKDKYETKTVIMATGGRRRRLNVTGKDKFEGKGVVYCSTCDAPLFKDKVVAVIGGGNAGLEAVVDLFPYANKIYLLNRGDQLKGDPSTQEEVKKSDKVEVILNADTTEILGDKFVSGLKYKDLKSGEEKELELGGIFVEIGSVPNSEIVKGLVELNKFGEIVIDHKNHEASKPGIFAAGDVTDELYKQNNISVGDAVSAALSAYNYVLKIKKQSPAAELTLE